MSTSTLTQLLNYEIVHSPLFGGISHTRTDVSLALPLKKFQCWSDWWRLLPVPWRSCVLICSNGLKPSLTGKWTWDVWHVQTILLCVLLHQHATTNHRSTGGKVHFILRFTRNIIFHRSTPEKVHFILRFTRNIEIFTDLQGGKKLHFILRLTRYRNIL